MRVTTKGQVTIPQQIRDRAGFVPGTEVDFIIGVDGVVRVVMAGQGAVERSRKLGSVITRLKGSSDVGLSTDEIMALTRE